MIIGMVRMPPCHPHSIVGTVFESRPVRRKLHSNVGLFVFEQVKEYWLISQWLLGWWECRPVIPTALWGRCSSPVRSAESSTAMWGFLFLSRLRSIGWSLFDYRDGENAALSSPQHCGDGVRVLYDFDEELGNLWFLYGWLIMCISSRVQKIWVIIKGTLVILLSDCISTITGNQLILLENALGNSFMWKNWVRKKKRWSGKKI